MLSEKAKSSALIGSDRVEGTAVYGTEGEKIGAVERVLIEKRSGQARDVEISVGSFLGMGGTLHSFHGTSSITIPSLADTALM